MCTLAKYSPEQGDTEIIKNATQADASIQKANAKNRTGVKGLVSENIKTTNNGVEEDVLSAKKKLLGE